MTNTKHTPFRAAYNNVRREYEIFDGKRRSNAMPDVCRHGPRRHS